MIYCSRAAFLILSRISLQYTVHTAGGRHEEESRKERIVCYLLSEKERPASNGRRFHAHLSVCRPSFSSPLLPFLKLYLGAYRPYCTVLYILYSIHPTSPTSRVSSHPPTRALSISLSKTACWCWAALTSSGQRSFKPTSFPLAPSPPIYPPYLSTGRSILSHTQ